MLRCMNYSRGDRERERVCGKYKKQTFRWKKHFKYVSAKTKGRRIRQIFMAQNGCVSIENNEKFGWVDFFFMGDIVEFLLHMYVLFNLCSWVDIEKNYPGHIFNIWPENYTVDFFLDNSFNISTWFWFRFVTFQPTWSHINNMSNWSDRS